MIAIAVDDEPLMLGALTKAIKASSAIASVASFTSCEDALDFIKSNPADVAFLDINMRGMGGLSLAEKMIGFRPECKIVFCTGYEEYAIPAFKLHASGYLMKPISAKDVQAEIDNIKGIRQREKPLTVRCFGNFEVYAKGEKLAFKRSKTKELFADPKHPYTIGLMNSIPDIDDEHERLNTLEGLVPSLYEMPKGCRFAPRCQFACAECEQNRIHLTDLENGRQVRCRRYENV